MWKSCWLMKPPSFMLTSEPLMVAMPLRPATGNKRLCGARQPPLARALASLMATYSSSSLWGTMMSLSSR
ncbi:hypothetical protein D3C71_1814150 [compost metagenome]